MSAVIDETALDFTTDVSPTTNRTNRRGVFLAFMVGLALAGAVSFAVFQGGAVGKSAPSAQPALLTQADPRLERLLSLTESQRDCDTACLGDLRLRADKVAALEQALGNLQASATEAMQRASALEAEKSELTEQMGRKETELAQANNLKIQALEQEKAGLAAQMERTKTELEAGFKKTIASLETEKAALTDQIARKESKLSSEHKRQIETLEREKAGLAAQLDKQKSEFDASHQTQIAALEKRLAEAESQTGRQPQVRPAPERQARQQAAEQTERPAQKPAAVRASGLAQNAPRATAAPASAQQWSVIGMTASTVVVSTPDRRVVALAAGESLDGLTVHRIDLDKGVAETSMGNLAYKK